MKITEITTMEKHSLNMILDHNTLVITTEISLKIYGAFINTEPLTN